MFKVNKEKCVGCQACLTNCPGATKMNEGGKAEIIDQEKLEQCGGERVCPIEAIEKTDGQFQPPSSFNRGPDRGMGIGQGRGLGKGPRDGRGMGRGGGGRR